MVGIVCGFHYFFRCVAMLKTIVRICAACRPAAGALLAACVLAGLPGAAANPPTVVVDGNNQVTVTIYWKPPSDPADQAPHQYVAQTQIQP